MITLLDFLARLRLELFMTALQKDEQSFQEATLVLALQSVFSLCKSTHWCSVKLLVEHGLRVSE